MGMLKRLADGTRRPLPARLLIGRAPSAGLRLDERHVSGEHATVRWTGSNWELRDLSSRNGTFVDAERLAPGGAVVLAQGAQVAFGEEGDRWELADSGPPGAYAERVPTGEIVLAEAGMLALPSVDCPRALVFADARGNWILERLDEVQARLVDGDMVVVDADTWRVRVPVGIEETAMVDRLPRIDAVHLRFEVSRDEEHVQLVLSHSRGVVTLEHREHWYVLLSLARQRLEDHDQPPAEQGWIDRDRLLRMHRMDSNALNVAIYRARGGLSAAGIEGAAGAVEVRRGHRRIGLEPDRLEVVPLT